MSRPTLEQELGDVVDTLARQVEAMAFGVDADAELSQELSLASLAEALLAARGVQLITADTVVRGCFYHFENRLDDDLRRVLVCHPDDAPALLQVVT